MFANPSPAELEKRIAGLFDALLKSGRSFDTAIIISKINQYYFTGTMQDGILILRRDGTVAYYIRRSYERAKLESPLNIIYAMSTYRDLLSFLPANLGSTFFEMEVVPLSILDRLRKYFIIEEIHALDQLILDVRAVKSEYELAIMAESGRQHQQVLLDIVPQLLREGISETDFLADLYSRMVKLGYHGVTRFSMFQTEIVTGQLGFGTSSIYPSSFYGPGGMLGMSPAVPFVGNRNSYLKRGDIVYIDIGYGVHGYHSDKTQVYSFGQAPTENVARIHNSCMDVLNRAVKLLTVGRIPADIYMQIMSDLPNDLVQNFMGAGGENVKFLGHGIGLHVDEKPVIAKGFNLPLQENMVIALEPKCGIEGVGNVGVEETYAVKATGPVCLTGGPREIIVV